MRKEIFESEEEMTEYHEYMRKCCGKISCSGMKCRKCKIATAKEAGFIKQNPVEKAEERIEKYRKQGVIFSDFEHDLIDALEYQKKQLEEKNNA